MGFGFTNKPWRDPASVLEKSIKSGNTAAIPPTVVPANDPPATTQSNARKLTNSVIIATFGTAVIVGAGYLTQSYVNNNLIPEVRDAEVRQMLSRNDAVLDTIGGRTYLCIPRDNLATGYTCVEIPK